jgi:hypothetical protein
MATIRLQRAGQGHEKRILLLFEDEPSITSLVKTLPGVRWDPFLKGWHVANNPENLRGIHSFATHHPEQGTDLRYIETPCRRAAGNPIPSRTSLLRCSLTPRQSRRGMRSPEFRNGWDMPVQRLPKGTPMFQKKPFTNLKIRSMTWSYEILCTCIYPPNLGRYIHIYMRNIYTCTKQRVMQNCKRQRIRQ